MAKGGKSASSASSGTRKKHARKAAGSMQPEEPYEKQKKVKSKEKGKNKEPRQKIYIPPVKPPPIQPDPLDTTGLALLLPPDLLVVLRKLGKKNTVTKISSLEELQSGWVDKYKKKDEDTSLVSTLLLMLPVWVRLPQVLLKYEFTCNFGLKAPSCVCVVPTPVPSYTRSRSWSPRVYAPHSRCS